MPDKESPEGHNEYASLFVLRQEAKRGDATRRRAAGLYLRRMLDAGRRDDQRRTPQLARTSHEDAGFASQWFRRNDVTRPAKITFAALARARYGGLLISSADHWCSHSLAIGAYPVSLIVNRLTAGKPTCRLVWRVFRKDGHDGNGI